MDPGYPRPISLYWKGVPSDIEGALPWYNGGVYVFKDTQTWFFLHNDDSVDVLSSYPKSVTNWWSDASEITGYTVFRYAGSGVSFSYIKCLGYLLRQPEWRRELNMYGEEKR